MAIPLFDTSATVEPLHDQLRDAILGVVDSGRYVLGPEVQAFERDLADYVGAGDAVGVGNGTDAITIALRALDVGPGDDVVVPSFTFYASVEAIPATGARPVFCDIDPDTFCVTAETVKAALTPNTKAVIAVHLFGNVAPIAEIEALGGDFNSLLAELDDWHHHLRRENERLSHRAAHDDLTGLPNRASFEQCLSSALVQARQDGQPFALLYLDGDGFKAVNDRFGHAAGDAVLVEIAIRLKACLRAGDIAARLGGDEFGLLLAAPAGRDAIARVQLCLSERMGYPIRLPSGDKVRVGLSVGSAVFPEDGNDAAALVNVADSEMYAAKQRAER